MSPTHLLSDLAATFRLAARFGRRESAGNHFCAAVSEDGAGFLMNPKWSHFSAIRASDLPLLDTHDDTTLARPDAPDTTARWSSRRHPPRCAGRAGAAACHPARATALACLKDPTLPPIDRNTALFHGRVAVDFGFGGMADTVGEGTRLAAVLGNRTVLMMGNHGVTIAGGTVAEAFERLHFFERAARTVLLAHAGGRSLNVMPEAVAEKTARAWRDHRGMADAHFAHLKSTLDATDPSCRE